MQIFYMVKKLPFLISLLFIGTAYSQNVGIGTTTPDSTLHVIGGVKIPSLYNSVSGTDSMIVRKADGGFAIRVINSGGLGGGVNYVVQSLAPADTTTFWLDTSAGIKGVWPLKQRVANVWRTVQWYDPISNFLSEKRPLYVLGTGQSNMIYRGTGGELSVDNRVVEYANGAWAIANRSAANLNNIALQFAKEIARKQNRVVRFSVVAESSQPIEKWYHDSTKTDEIAALIRAAQIDSFDVILFRQGEQNADVGNDSEAAYGAKVSQVFTAYRDSAWFGKSGRVLLGGLNENYFNFGVFNYYQRLNDQSKGGGDFTSVSMLGLDRSGGIHINGASIDTVGRRYAETYLGQPRQYSLEKTPNIKSLTDAEFNILSYASNPATLRLTRNILGRLGGFIKMPDGSVNLQFGVNNTINGATSSDSISFDINSFNQTGFGLTNNTTSTNQAQVQIRSYFPMAFTIGGSNEFQIDNIGRFRKPVNVYNRFSSTGDLIIHSQSGDIMNGVLRFSRLNMTGTQIPSYNGSYDWYNGSTNVLFRGVHNSTDTTWANRIDVLGVGTNGISIRTGAAPTARVHISPGLATASNAPLKFTAGTNLTTPENGAVEYDGTNYFVTSGGVRYTLQRVASVPASASASGVTGSIAYDSGFIYVCVSTNTWVRAALETW